MSRSIKRPLTTRDIAQAASVNQSTVSRALRNDPKISPAIRAKIQKIAKEIGYKPNPFVAAFAAQVRNYRRSPNDAVLAFLDCNSPGEDLNSLYREGAAKRAADHGFRTEIFNMHELDFSLKRLNTILWTRSIFGLLILPVPLGYNLSELAFDRLATSTVDTTLHNPVLHRAESNYFQGMQLALKKLEDRGYSRIAFCTTRHEVELLGTEWLGGFAGWQAMKRARERTVPYIGQNWDPVPFNKWLKKTKPDAIIANTHCFFEYAKNAGFTAPQVAHVTLCAGAIHPGLAGISQNQSKVGMAAIDIILAQIHRNDYGLPDLPKTVLIQSSWIDGKSVRKSASL